MENEQSKYELTEEEMVYYANHDLIDMCDCCKDWTPITNRHDGSNFLTLTGNKLYCQKCLN